MAGSEWFGKQDLGLKYGIVIGALIIITVVCAVCKLIYTKQRVKKFEKVAEAAQLERGEAQHNHNEKVEDEGDLFGLRALEKGFFGGVAQSRPVSIGSSTLALPPSAHLCSQPSTELGNQRSIDRTPPTGYVVPRPGLHGSPDMHLMVPHTPAATVAHRPDRSRSPSPTASTNSQTSTVNSALKLHSSSPLSVWKQAPAGMVGNGSTDSFTPSSRIPGEGCYNGVKQVREPGRGTLGSNSASNI